MFARARSAAVVAVLAVGCSLMLATSASARVGSPARSSVPAGAPQHIFWIMMENHAYDEIIGNKADAPFINQLAAKNGLATNYFGVTHPSLPNYLASISGDFQGIWDDCKAGADVMCAPEEFVPGSGDGTDGNYLTAAQIASASNTPHLFGGQNIVDQLESAGLTWKAYMQSMPSVGSEVEYAPIINGTTVKLYAQKHNPFMYFSDINSPGNPRLNNIVPLEGNLASDLASGNVPNFVWISPDQCHDMHGISPSTAALVNMKQCGFPDSGLDHGAIKLGDQFLAKTVGQIKSSPVWQDGNSTIVITWDEDDYAGFAGTSTSPTGVDGITLGGAQVPTIVINSSGGGHVVDGDPANHYNTLATIEQAWGLGCLGQSCASSPLTSLFPH
jgi:phosphatidylinositol-3-phosphatase